MLLAVAGAAVGGASLAMPRPEPRYEGLGEIRRALRGERGELLHLGGGRIKVVFAEDAGPIALAPVLDWVGKAARAVTAYFGQFPVADYELLVVSEDGDGIGHATTFGQEGAVTRVHVGVGAGREAFQRDWVLVHELVHTALPDLPRRSLWLQEGNATYVEPIARAMIGQLAPSEPWREAVEGMPRGLPHIDDGGMDGTQAWGRLYWGGAIFWLRVEIALYRDTQGVCSLRDVLRHINRKSGGNAAFWSPEQLVAAGDEASKTGSMSRLYALFARERVDTDLAELFGQLGVRQQGDRIGFDDGAPLAALRRRITATS